MKNIISLIAFLVFVLVSLQIMAQPFNIKGKITDSKSGESMIGVHVAIVGDVYGTISNYKGEFILTT